MVPEPRRDPTQVGCDPHPGAASVTRKRVPACRPVVGVAAEVATWSPSSHGTPRGSPEPPERSISDRLLIAARSPLRAIPRRPPGGALTAPAFVAGSRPGPFYPATTLRFFLSRLECLRIVVLRMVRLGFFFKSRRAAVRSPLCLQIIFVIITVRLTLRVFDATSDVTMI